MPAALSSWRGPASVAFGGATLMAAGAARAGVQAFDTAALTAHAYTSELSERKDLPARPPGLSLAGIAFEGSDAAKLGRLTSQARWQSTDPANKIALDPEQHYALNRFWMRYQRYAGGGP